MRGDTASLHDRTGMRTKSPEAPERPVWRKAENVAEPLGPRGGVAAREFGIASEQRFTEPEASAAETRTSSCECTIKQAFVLVCVIKEAIFNGEQSARCERSPGMIYVKLWRIGGVISRLFCLGWERPAKVAREDLYQPVLRLTPRPCRLVMPATIGVGGQQRFR